MARIIPDRSAEPIGGPQFLYIGADKSGSTWLQVLLMRHPGIYVPSCKDTYFFERNYHRGWDWYLTFFRHARADQLRGEVCHDYMYSAEAANRIAQDLPSVKLIIFLRDPYDRTFADYLYMVRNGMTRQSFVDELKTTPDLWTHSCYGRALEPYLKAFRRESLRVCLFDDLRRDPRQFASDILEFLEVGTPANLPYEERVLPASRARSVRLARLGKAVARWGTDHGFESAVGSAKRNSAVLNMFFKPYDQASRPRMSESDIEALRPRLEPDLQRASAALGLDLVGRWSRD
ncbi:MAG: sulfotransferase [Acidimicrobiales bacterium]